MSNILKDMDNGVELRPILPRHHKKKWQLAFTALYSSRAFYQARKIVAKNQDKFLKKFSPSPSYSAIDIEPERLPRIDESKLSKLVRDKNTKHLTEFGGVKGLVTALETHADMGIQAGTENISLRRQIFGSNTVQKPSVKVLQVVLETLKDPIIVILLACASLSLGFGVKKNGLGGISDGLSIILSILLVISVTSSCNIWITRQFHMISIGNDNIFIDVVRKGSRQKIPTFEIVVGDVVWLQTGDQVPADGLYIHGHCSRVNESNLSKDLEANVVDITPGITNPFLLSGSKVTQGNARMLVTAVGMNTKWGEIVSSTCFINDKTPLQVKLHKLTRRTTKVGLLVASLVLIVLLIRYFTGNLYDDTGKVDLTSDMTKSTGTVCKTVVGILVTPIVIATTAIPEGLLLAVTVTLVYSTKRMATDQGVVRNLSSCEAIGHITVICTDESGSLTLNSPKVNQFWLGLKNYSKSGACSLIAKEVLQLIHEGIGLNSPLSESSSELNENKIDEAVCSWGVEELGINVKTLKENCSVLDPENLNLQRKLGSICIQRKMDNTIHLHLKGSPDIILATCSCYYEENGQTRNINNNAKAAFEKIIQEMKNSAIHCIAYAHAVVSREDDDDSSDENFHPKLREEGMTLIGILGLKDPVLPNTSKAVLECQKAGVNVKMLTAKDVHTAKASAIECGILNPNQTTTKEDIIEGTEFQNYTDQERLEKVDNLSVLANASSLDKHIMVQCLRQRGHVVGITRGCLTEESVLKKADVNLSLGTQRTPGVKEKDVIFLDGIFPSIARTLRWGRGIYANRQMYTQFQLTATISSLVIDSVSTIFTRDPPAINSVTVITAGKVPHAALQVLWVKLIVGTLIAVALTADEPAENLMQQALADPIEPFITNIMWRNIIGQALCQIIILLTIQFNVETTFNLNAREKDTLIFNIFVLSQISTTFNTVKGKNIFEGLKGKRRFWIIIGVILAMQVVIVELLKRFADTERLSWKQWRACIGITILSSLIGWLLKRIPVPEKPLCLALTLAKNQNAESL